MRIRRGQKTSYELFLAKIDRNGPIPETKENWPELSGRCWVWTASKRKHGHGYFFFDGSIGCAHRFSWMVHFGDIPEGLSVLHKCDNGACVNPDHLFLGDQLENMRDCSVKNRNNKGEKAYNAVFTEVQVLEIRKRHKEGARIFELMRDFNRGRSAISHIVTGNRWKHLP